MTRQGESGAAARAHAGRAVPEAWVQLLRAHSALTRALDADLRARHGLTLGEYELLLHLSWADRAGVRRSDLASAVFLTQGGVTRMVQRLESAGLVESTSDPDDGRVVRTRLTPRGRRQFERAAATHVTGVDEGFTTRLTATELETLSRLLARFGGTPTLGS